LSSNHCFPTPFNIHIRSPILRMPFTTPHLYATRWAFCLAMPPPCTGSAPLPPWERPGRADAALDLLRYSSSSQEVAPGPSTSSCCSLHLAFPKGKTSFPCHETQLEADLRQESLESLRLPKPLLTLRCGVHALTWYIITCKCLL